MGVQLKIITGTLTVGCLAIIVFFVFSYKTTLISPAVYTGVIEYGFEGSEFSPCFNLDKHWWVSADKGDIGLEPHFVLTQNHYQPAYIEALMEVSNRGEFGHGGSWERKVTLLEVYNISTRAPYSCGRASQ